MNVCILLVSSAFDDESPSRLRCIYRVFLLCKMTEDIMTSAVQEEDIMEKIEVCTLCLV